MVPNSRQYTPSIGYFSQCHVNHRHFLLCPDDFLLTEMFVVNVFEQTKGKEMDLICNQVVANIMEKLLPLANSENLQHFADLMLNDM
jgi:hypothetical protein